MTAHINNSGCYILVIALEQPTTITIGALGERRFRSGQYCYVGRAKNNLSQRVERHLRTDKKRKWHIDFLLEHSRITKIYSTTSLDECRIAAGLAELPGAEVVDGFGSSDCRCPGHLIAAGSKPDASQIAEQLSGITLVPYTG